MTVTTPPAAPLKALPPLVPHPDFLLSPGDIDPYRVLVTFYTEEQGPGHAVVFTKAHTARLASQMALDTLYGYLRSIGQTVQKNHVTPLIAVKGVDAPDWDWNDEMRIDEGAAWDEEMGLTALIAAENELLDGD